MFWRLWFSMRRVLQRVARAARARRRQQFHARLPVEQRYGVRPGRIMWLAAEGPDVVRVDSWPFWHRGALHVWVWEEGVRVRRPLEHLQG
jgi:hypothetical protein